MFVSIATSDDDTGGVVVYTIEAEELSFTLDHQDRATSYHLKLSSLQANTNDNTSSSNDNRDDGGCNGRRIHARLFSSKCPVLTDSMSKLVDLTYGRPVSPPFSPPTSQRGKGSFIIMEVITHTESHRPTKVKLVVQMFQMVLWMPLFECLVDILGACIEKRESSEFGGRGLDNGRGHAAKIWPHLSIVFRSSRFVLPGDSSVGHASFALLIDSESFSITSDLDFPISRHVLNSVALRKLSTAAAERRIPPLPGYQALSHSVQCIGVTWSTNDSRYI